MPADVSVVGFDDDPLAQWTTPMLTTVRQPFLEMGKAALAMLCDLLDHPGRKIERRVLPVELVPRDSVADAPPR